MKKKYTLSGLPVVSKDTIEIFIRDLEKRAYEPIKSWDKFGKELEENIEKENPNLTLLAKFINESMSEDAGPMNVGFILAYSILRRQLEINKLEEDYKD